MYNHNIETWWKHLGCYDREQVSGIPYGIYTLGEFLTTTDDWWENLSYEQREDAYDEFFSEN